MNGRTLLIGSFVAILLLMPPTVEAENCTGNWGATLGSYRSVTAYSNGTTLDCDQYSGTYGFQYQCVEYVDRFFTDAMHFSSSGWTGNGVDYYGSAETKGLRQFAQGGTTKPKENDILCFSGNTFGHVGILTEVGSNYVEMIDQNRTTSDPDDPKQLTLTQTGNTWSVTSFSGSFTVQGWLRGYTSDYDHQTPVSVINLAPGQEYEFKVWYRNTSRPNAPHWKSDGSSHSIELRSCTNEGTEVSSFFHPVSGKPNWLDPTERKRVVRMTQSDVGTDGIAEFSFWAKVPDGATPGRRDVYFRPYHESGQWIEEWDGMSFAINVYTPPPPSPPPVALTLILRDPSAGSWWARVSDGESFVFPTGPNSPTDLWRSGWAAEGQYTFTPYVGDPNGDGYDDLIVWRNDAKWYVAWNQQNGSFTDQGAPIHSEWGTGAYAGRYFFWFCNITGDSRDEMLTYDASNGGWYVCTFNSSTNVYESCSSWLTWGAGVGTFQPLVGDWTGDGKTDICLRNWSTGDHWVRKMNDGGTAFVQPSPDNWEAAWGGSGSPTTFTPLVGNWNGTDTDGKKRDDILLYHIATGNWWVRLSNNTGTDFIQPSPDLWYSGWGASSVFSPFVGDFNDDGRTDVGLRNTTTGDHWVRLANTGGTAFTQPSPDNWCAAWLGTSSSQLIVGRFGGTPAEGGQGSSMYIPPQPKPERALTFATSSHPNPFNPSVTILYTLPSTSYVRLDVFDVTGRHVATLVDRREERGDHNVEWNAAGNSSGVYFYRITVGDHTATRRLVLLK